MHVVKPVRRAVVVEEQFPIPSIIHTEQGDYEINPNISMSWTLPIFFIPVGFFPITVNPPF